MWTVHWKGNAEACVDTIEDLDLLLDGLHSEHYGTHPLMAVVESKTTGDSLTIGLGRPLSVLNFIVGSGDPPYFTSSGSLAQDTTIEFDFMGEATEFPLRNAVPIAIARDAVREFALLNRLPERFQWEEV